MPSFPHRSQPLLVGRPEGPSEGEGSDAATIGTNLYHLALKYWSEGRPEDAMRVGRQAVEVLGKDDRAAEVVTALTTLLQEIGPEVAEDGEHPTPA